MISKVVIANRGEIALRILRACRDLGISTVALHSDIDGEAKYVKLADESVCIGPAPAPRSYLNIPAVIAAAEVTNANAIHPGYGFLAENADFAERVEQSGFTFIGPSPQAIRTMGNKIEAIRTMKKAGLQCVPGSGGALGSDIDEIKVEAARIGYPVLIKAAAGGGGKGLRLVENESQLQSALALSVNESAMGFGDSTLYLEKFLHNPRHIEIQILSDQYGNAVHLGDRDCSIQRRRQKLIEEAPAFDINEELRNRLGQQCVTACKELGYTGAGTFEFLFDGREFYFIEMNTRVQVEHTVTEMVTGIDIVKEQIKIAGGAKLSFRQEEIRIDGHAIECRINAEHPQTLMPSPGRIVRYHPPGGPGVRVDSHIYSNYEITPHYDSLIAKVVAHGQDRSEAIARMRGALEELVVDGVATTIELHQDILMRKKFQRGAIDINYLERIFEKQISS
ncbi:MAG: acetyl-CoA carboxylase biotin carboxylase subunit [Acidiferrobacterales bacterium]|nr:acetyl-CoA carboxylase biotin carboxylase subunit [Acidiferrobacterales bacterium]